MTQGLPLKLRSDLVITPLQDKENASERYMVKDPISGEIFEFGEEEFFLCQCLDGNSRPSEIIQRFESQFGLSLTPDYLQQFVLDIEEFGLLERVRDFPSVRSATQSTASLAPTASPTLMAERNGTKTSVGVLDVENPFRQSFTEEDLFLSAAPQLGSDDEDGDEESKGDRWCLFNPTPLLKLLVGLFSPIRPFMRFLVWLLVPAVIIATILFFKNQALLWQDIALLKEPTSYLGSLLGNLLTINLISRLAIGAVCVYYGGEVQEFGLRLRFGFLPRFYIDTHSITRFNRRAKLWTYGTALLLRVVLFVLGIALWFGFRNTGTHLSTWAISLAQAGFIGFIIVSIPIRTSYGYRWLTTYANLPPTLLRQALHVFTSTFRRQPLPTTISAKSRFSLWCYALLIVICWSFFAVKITLSIGIGLASSFPNIFGQATQFLLVCLVALLIFRWFWDQHFQTSKSRSVPTGLTSASISQTDYSWPNRPRSKPNRWVAWLKRGIVTGVLVAVGFALVMPYPYRPGGQIQLLPPDQQLVQAPVSGQVTTVFFNGGDGQWLKAGTVIASMVSTELQNEIATLQEQVRQQQAEIEKQKSALDKVKAGPRSEEVEVSQRQVAIAQQAVQEAQKQFEVSQANIGILQKQLETAQIQFDFSRREVERLEQLYAQGGYALQQVETVRAEAETHRMEGLQVQEQLKQARKQVESAAQNTAIKSRELERAEAQLNLVLSGSSPEDIRAAEQSVASAQAQLASLQQNLSYAQTQLKNAQLLMPLDGYLVEAYLKQKVGSYLNQGETFAAVQNDRIAIAELQLPEYDSGELNVGAPTSVKLLAYPNTPFEGKVMSIEPTTTEEAYGRVLKVLIRLDNVDQTLKAGMTGYAKISAGEKPLIVLLTRPIVRFVQIELWSWLP
ncbi:MAG TPA: efflux RND transporter periplasmic adaptor subunit [Leptolyngbyaceae cyanobacterium]